MENASKSRQDVTIAIGVGVILGVCFGISIIVGAEVSTIVQRGIKDCTAKQITEESRFVGSLGFKYQWKERQIFSVPRFQEVIEYGYLENIRDCSTGTESPPRFVEYKDVVELVRTKGWADCSNGIDSINSAFVGYFDQGRITLVSENLFEKKTWIRNCFTGTTALVQTLVYWDRIAAAIGVVSALVGLFANIEKLGLNRKG
ncbi:MAG: hypothetical protein HY070_00340 [Chloroflexi bacterium]|nr:hypothetical protein [Chloroflexota bacterium]